MNKNIHPYLHHLFDLYSLSKHISFSDSGFFINQALLGSKPTIHINYNQIVSVMEYGDSVVFILSNEDRIVFSKDGLTAPIYLSSECEKELFLSKRQRYYWRFKKRVYSLFKPLK